MGTYLATPKTEKESEDDEDYRFRVGASSMQGWRMSQQDAHNAILDYGDGISLFGVYDGHGGHEVALYTADKLPNFIKALAEYEDARYSEALEKSFIAFDETLIEDEVVEALTVIAKTEENNEEDADPNEVDNLCHEATMPIEDLIAKYKEERENSKILNGLKAGSSKKPISPFLSAKKSSCNEEKALPNSHIRFEDSADEKPTSPQNGTVKEDESCDNGDKAPQNGTPVESTLVVKEEEKKINGASVPFKGKGKGKGKGKSNDIPPKPKKENEPEPLPPVVLQSPIRKPKKTAEELYKNMLTDGQEDSSDDDEEDDDDVFLNAKDSSDEDDDDDEEDMEEESEPDTEEEEDDEGEDVTPSGAQFDDKPGNDSGCTAVVALVVKDELFVANAGDSRCVVCRNGEAVEMSFDHKPEDPPEQNRIKKAGGTVTSDGRVDGGLNLSRALGDHAYKGNKFLPLIEQMISPQPDIRTLKIDPKTDSFIVLACDGIWNSMSSQAVVDFIKPRLEEKPTKVSSICEEMFDLCLSPNTMGDGTGCDNMTAVIVEIKSTFNSVDPSPKRPLSKEYSCASTSKKIKTNDDESTDLKEENKEKINIPDDISDKCAETSS